jgi:hypothetical protein
MPPQLKHYFNRPIMLSIPALFEDEKCRAFAATSAASVTAAVASAFTDVTTASVMAFNQYVNRAILASIPALFEDGECRVYTLRAIDSDGLWLESPALANRLLPSHEKVMAALLTVFVPTAQIAALILAAPSLVEEPPKTDAAKTGAQDQDKAATAAPTKPKPASAKNQRPEQARRADTKASSQNVKTKAARKH